MIIEKWNHIAEEIEVVIYVIDMTNLDTRNDTRNLVCKSVDNIVLKILSFITKTERKSYLHWKI